VKIVRRSLGEGGPDSFRRFDWQGQPSLTGAMAKSGFFSAQ